MFGLIFYSYVVQRDLDLWVEQPDLYGTITEIWVPCQCEFIEGFSEDLMSRLDKSNDPESLLIFDDVMNEVSSNATIQKLFIIYLFI